jgi:hypothetical protein
LAAEFVDRIKENSKPPTAEPSPSGSSQQTTAGKTEAGSKANSTATNSADGMRATIAYQTSITWESSKLGCCRVVVIAPSDTTEERLKVLGRQLRHELQESRATWVWIYDEFKAVQLEADRSPTGFTPESALEPIYSHLVASYMHEDAATPDEFYFSSRSEPTFGKYRWRRILYSSDGPGPVTVVSDGGAIGPDIRELKKALTKLPTPQGHSVNDDQRPQQSPAKSEVRSEFRTWTDASGKHKTEAQFNGMAFGKVKLLKRNGGEITIPLEKLSDNDKEWIKQQGHWALWPDPQLSTAKQTGQNESRRLGPSGPGATPTPTNSAGGVNATP